MAKINSKALDPQRYACIQAEQRELEHVRRTPQAAGHWSRCSGLYP